MFTRMDEGSQEDWEHIGAEHLPHIVDMPNRVIAVSYTHLTLPTTPYV